MNIKGLKDLSISDKEEHLRLILLEIDTQNKVLSNILSDKDFNLEIINSLKKQILLLESEINKLDNNILEKEKKLNEIETSYEETLNKKKKISSDIVVLEKKLKKLVNEFNENITIYEQRIDFLKEEYKNINTEIIRLTNIITEKEDYILQKDIKIKALQEESDLIKKDIDNIKRDRNLFISRFNNERDELIIEIDKARNSILRPMQLLAETNQTVESRERNLGVLIKRFRKEFKKMHPNQEPKI